MTNKGDLISREALKAIIIEPLNVNDACKNDWYEGYYTAKNEDVMAIDNAPTVEVTDYDTGYQDGLEDGLNDIRPQGEWIYGEDDCGQDGWFCSECNFFVPWYYQYYEKDIDFIRDYKVCPHCLAEMVTYTGKDRDTKGGAE